MTPSRDPSRSSGNRVKTTLGYSSNARANQAAWKRMSVTEREVGKTVEQIRADHAEQKARVLERYGIQKAA